MQRKSLLNPQGVVLFARFHPYVICSSVEICNSDIIMCPLCHKLCEYRKLNESCFFSEVTYLFDNPATVFFSIFMAFWGEYCMAPPRRPLLTLQSCSCRQDAVRL